jgi:lipopolysaccharide transport system ATP-binding protein
LNGTIRLRRLGKAYRRYPAPGSRLVEWLTLGHLVRHSEIWALRDVTLDVTAGEAVGIIGANGAGKSTLLKLIAATATPSEGTCDVHGSVAAILELGLGFHPDFTGRENAFMAGQLMGYSREQLRSQMPRIEEFAEIGSYIDLPVRTYSSGMQVRLAFSAATAFRPDILIVDEALAVGDAYFQHKSFARIREFKEQGTTLLFVSHSPAIVKSVCDRAILIDRGLKVRDGTPDAVVDYYNALIARREAEYEISTLEGHGVRSGNRSASVERVELLYEGRSATAVPCGAPVTFRVTLRANAELPELTVGMLLKDAVGNDVFGTNTYHLGRSLQDIGAGNLLCCDFDIGALALGTGSYSLSVALHRDMTHVSGNYDWWDRALVFQVLPGSSPHFIGIAMLDVACRVRGDKDEPAMENSR